MKISYMFIRSFKILYKVRSKMKNFSVHSAVSNDSVSLIKSIPQIVKLINALYEKDLIFMNNFVELVLGEHDFVTLDDFISYPYKPIRNYFCREINNQGEVVLNNMATIDTSAKISPPVLIGQGARIGPYTIIRGGTIVSANCKLVNVEVNNSFIGVGTTIMHGHYVGYSFLSENCRFGSSFTTAVTKFQGVDQRPTFLNLRNAIDGKIITIIERSHFGVITEPNCYVGCNVITMPGTYLSKGIYKPCSSLGGSRPKL